MLTLMLTLMRTGKRAVTRSLIGAAFVLVAGIAPAIAKDTVAPTTIKAGEAVYARCMACHALGYDRTGPRHCGLFGRRAGSVPGFAYSEAMTHSGIIWNEKTLDRFLKDPIKAVAGTSMGYAGVKDDKERAALIAYLRQANDSAECKKRQE